MTDTIKLNKLVDCIAAAAAGFAAPVRIMEVCGSHTMAIAKLGLKQLLPDNIELLSGPGCPVCVTPQNAIDQIIQLACQPDVILTSFGDMLRVPGSSTSLAEAKAQGADIRVVYSPSESLIIAQENPTCQVVFAAVGFETTAPVTALLLQQALISYSDQEKCELDNFSVFCEHKRLVPALEWLCNQSDIKLDAFLLPGHVSTIIGVRPYEDFAAKYRVPGVIAGFSALEILQAILDNLLILQKVNMGSDPKLVLNDYPTVVRAEGNTTALQLMKETFEVTASEWRGLGTISNSGYAIAPKYARFDAKHRFANAISQAAATKPNEKAANCRCGDILTGRLHPSECPLFATACTPGQPIGPCMVSQEGSCAAAYLLK